MGRMWIETRLFAIKSKMVCLFGTQRELGQSPKECNSALLKCRSSLQKCWSALQKCLITLSCSGAFWTPFLSFLEPGLALRLAFNPYSYIFISFLDNSDLFRNNYLVDKYPKINFDNVQIIYNFIIIQLFILFLYKQSYFIH